MTSTFPTTVPSVSTESTATDPCVTPSTLPPGPMRAADPSALEPASDQLPTSSEAGCQMLSRTCGSIVEVDSSARAASKTETAGPSAGPQLGLATA